jgi:hypothetical protein
VPSDELSNLADRVDALASELDDIMFDRLRAASAARAGRPAADRRLLQARRSLDKAARVLRTAQAGEDEPDESSDGG